MLGRRRIVMLLAATTLTDADVERLANWVAGGGGLAIFASDRLHDSVSRRLSAAGLLPGEVGPTASPAWNSWRDAGHAADGVALSDGDATGWWISLVLLRLLLLAPWLVQRFSR